MHTVTYTSADHVAAADADLRALRARHGVATVVHCRDFSELRIIYAGDAPAAAPTSLTLEPMTDKPAGSDSRVILDARNVDHWSRTYAR